MGDKGRVILTAGLGYGDEGKGTIVDYLTRLHRATLVVRYNGGAQAGHNVVDDDGRHHTFSQFGSGTLVPGVKTHLSRFMVVNPLGMMREDEHLASLGVTDAFQRLTIDRSALVTTPFQIIQNRLLEIQRGDKRHGSCGLGVGQTINDFRRYGDQVLFISDFTTPSKLRAKLRFIRDEKWSEIWPMIKNTESEGLLKQELGWFKEPEALDFLTDLLLRFAAQIVVVDETYLAAHLHSDSTIIFEGSQGVLLDVMHGFWPHVTKTNITFNQAHELLEGAKYWGDITKIGILRAYATRHGAGPLVTEDNRLIKQLADVHNQTNEWQGSFRVGWFDLVATRYALNAIGKIDYLAVTNLDKLYNLRLIKVCVAYEYLGDSPNSLNDYFDYIQNNGNQIVITGIKFLSRPGQEHQNRMREILAECRPLYVEVDKDTHLRFLEEQIGIPIFIKSFGPMAKDKELLRAHTKI